MAMSYPAGVTRTWAGDFPAEVGLMYSRPTLPALPGFATPFHRERYFDSVNMMVPIARAPVMALSGLGDVEGLGEAVRCFGARAVPAMNAARARGEQALRSLQTTLAAERANPGSVPTSWFRGVLNSFAAAFEPGPGQWCQQTPEVISMQTDLLSLLRNRPHAVGPTEPPMGPDEVRISRDGVPLVRTSSLAAGVTIGLVVGGVAAAIYYFGKRAGKKSRKTNRSRRRNGRVGDRMRAEAQGFLSDAKKIRTAAGKAGIPVVQEAAEAAESAAERAVRSGKKKDFLWAEDSNRMLRHSAQMFRVKW